ncbi:hypothetical protein FHL15_006985 [Xylaria flabelliformis]|uniref:Uncharacterized protein n=1 Tax=Xylaria flabelliformis TaxID=2512241 RepID=A0A553HW01_9PEZI|nr:hypothetical protein FHL15_006985 [Xylaria flabelliformis]
MINNISGFSPAGIDSGFLCTSSITTPMAFLLDPNISTADIYTTLPPKLWIEHDQMTAQWEPTDLEFFPVAVASQYARLMGITAPPLTDNFATETTIEVLSSSTRTPRLTAAPTLTWPTSTPNTVTTTPDPQSSSSDREIDRMIDVFPDGTIDSTIFLQMQRWKTGTKRGVHVYQTILRPYPRSIDIEIGQDRHPHVQNEP